MDEATKIAYAEVFEILKYMDRNIVMKIPIDIVELFKRYKKENYESKIDINDIFNKENISKKALNILAWLNINYFSNPQEKEKLIELYRKNDYISEEEKKEKYDTTNLFSSKITKNDTSKENSVELVKYEKIKWYKKIWNKIVNMLK